MSPLILSLVLSSAWVDKKLRVFSSKFVLSQIKKRWILRLFQQKSSRGRKAKMFKLPCLFFGYKHEENRTLCCKVFLLFASIESFTGSELKLSSYSERKICKHSKLKMHWAVLSSVQTVLFLSKLKTIKRNRHHRPFWFCPFFPNKSVQLSVNSNSAVGKSPIIVYLFTFSFHSNSEVKLSIK